MALTSLTKPRARWATFKLNVVGAILRSLKDKIEDYSISPKDFGAIGDGTGDDTAAVLAAIEYSRITAWQSKVASDGLYAVANLVLPPKAYVDLNFTNVDNSDILLLNGDNINLASSTIVPKTGFTGWCIVADDTNPLTPTNLFSRLVADTLILDCLYARTAKGIKVNLTHTSCSLWNIKLLDIKGASKLFDVKVQHDGVSATAAYFNSNVITYKGWAWVDTPLTLDCGTGLSEVANNMFGIQLQPERDTSIEGVKILGGAKNTRNIIEGIVWDWHHIKNATDEPAILDLGQDNRIVGMPTDYVVTNETTQYVPSDGVVASRSIALVPTNDRDSTVAGRQDNILYYADKRADMTVTLSHPFDGYPTERLFDTNHYDSVRWNVASQLDERSITIDFNGDNRIISYTSLSTLYNGNPSNVKIEIKGSTGTWTTFVEKTNDISPVKGRTGIIRAYGIRFTCSAPKSIDIPTGAVTDSTFIAVNSVFAKSLTGAEWSPHMSTLNPVYYGDITIDEVVNLDISTYNQTQVFRVKDVAGNIRGYVPLYTAP